MHCKQRTTKNLLYRKYPDTLFSKTLFPKRWYFPNSRKKIYCQRCLCVHLRRAKHGHVDKCESRTLFRFPKDENLRSQWWEITGKKYASAHVCSKHFRPEDYRNYEDTNLIRRILKSSAVPQKNNNSDTVEFVQNCFLFNSVDLSFAESKDKRWEMIVFLFN